MNNNLTLSVTLTGDNRQLSGTLKDTQGDVRAFSTTTAQESQKAKTALAAPGREAGTVSEHLRTAGQDARTFGTETAQGGRQANQALTQAADQAQTATGHLDQLKAVAVGLGAAFVAMGVREFAGDVYETVSSAQKLQASLETVTGDINSASAAWDQMREFAKTTPFALEQSIQGFIRMKSLGLAPTEDTMRSFANTAAAMNTDLMQMVEAVADATTGEFERLLAYGIKARKEGDQIAFTFQGVTTRVQNSAEDIQSYLTAIGNTTFADAAIGQMDTLGGKANNLQDEMRDLHLAIGEAGATELFERGLNVASGAVEALTDNIDVLAKSTTIITTAGGAYVAYRGILVGVTAAQWAFNAAATANPLGLLITLAGAAAGAMIAFGNDTDKAAGRAERAANSVLGLTGEVENLTAAQIENRKVPLISAAFEAEREADSIRRLTAEYNEWIKAQTGTITFIPERFMGIGRDGGAVARLKDHQKAAELARGELAELEKVQASLGETTKDTGDAVDTGTRTLIEGTEASKEAAKAAAKQADELESLRNRMNPARRETIQYARDMNTLTTAFAAGRVGGGAFLALQGDIATRLATLGDTSTAAVETINDNTDAMGVLWENTLERMDDAGVDMWRSFLDGSEDAFSSFKRLAINTLAEVIHQYTTRQITASFGINAQGGGMGAGGGMGGGFSLDSLNPGMIKKGWDTVSGYFGAGAASSSAAVGYGGSGWAGSATNAGGWYGSATSSGAAAGGGWQSGLVNMGYAYAGGYLGTEIGEAAFGKTANSNYGQAIGTAVGTYFLPGIGTAVGAALGSAVDVLFGSGSEPKAYYTSGDDINYGRYGSPFGEFGFNIEDMDGDELTSLGDYGESLARFDETLAALMTDAQVDAATERMEKFNAETGDILGGMEEVSRERLGAIVSSVSDYSDRLLAETDGFAEMAQGAVNLVSFTNAVGDFSRQIQEDAEASLEASGKIGQHAGSLNQALAVVALLDEETSVLSHTFDDTAEGAIHAAYALQEAAGGIGRLAAVQQSYYQVAYTATERLTDQQSGLAYSLQQVTDTVPSTVAELREMVEAADLNTEAGRELALGLMELAPALTETSGAVRGAIQDAYQQSLGREVDSAGLDYWMDQVGSGALNLEQALGLIAESSEGAAASLSPLVDQLRTSVRARISELAAERDATIAIHRAQEEALQSQLATARASIQAEQAAASQRITVTREFLQEQIDAERSAHALRMDALNEQRDALSDQLAATRTIYSELSSAVDRMTLGTRDEFISQRSTAQSQLSAMQVGSIDPDELKRVLDVLTQDSQSLFTNELDWARDSVRTANAVDALREEAKTELTLGEQQLDAYNMRLEQADSQHQQTVSAWNAELTAANEQHELVMESLTAQLDQQKETYGRQIEQHRAAQQTAREQFEQESELLNQQLDTMTRQASAAEGTHLATQSVARAVADLEEALRDINSNSSDLAGYADGGISRGPTSGYAVELHGEEAVIPLKHGSVPVRLQMPRLPISLPSHNAHHSDTLTRALLDELRAIRAENRNTSRTLADRTSSLESIIKRWERLGMPTTREVSA